jgi:formiminotetrahydrofolate cyclodeaminase
MPASLTDLTIKSFLDAVAAKTPTPGGGSVSAVAGALGAAVGAMAAAFTESHAGSTAASALRDAADRLHPIADEDAEAFGRVDAAMKRPKGTPEEKQARAAALQDALRVAADVPLLGMRRCIEALGHAAAFAPACNPNLKPDLAVCALLLEAACRGCGLNVGANLDWIKDAAFVHPRAEERRTLEARAHALREQVMAACG